MMIHVYEQAGTRFCRKLSECRFFHSVTRIVPIERSLHPMKLDALALSITSVPVRYVSLPGLVDLEMNRPHVSDFRLATKSWAPLHDT